MLDAPGVVQKYHKIINQFTDPTDNTGFKHSYWNTLPNLNLLQKREGRFDGCQSFGHISPEADNTIG